MSSYCINCKQYGGTIHTVGCSLCSPNQKLWVPPERLPHNTIEIKNPPGTNEIRIPTPAEPSNYNLKCTACDSTASLDRRNVICPCGKGTLVEAEPREERFTEVQIQDWIDNSCDSYAIGIIRQLQIDLEKSNEHITNMLTVAVSTREEIYTLQTDLALVKAECLPYVIQVAEQLNRPGGQSHATIARNREKLKAANNLISKLEGSR